MNNAILQERNAAQLGYYSNIRLRQTKKKNKLHHISFELSQMPEKTK